MIQKDSDKGLAGKFAKKSRMQQEYPILVWDVYSDIRLVNEMISDIPFIFELSSDGDIVYPADTGINVLDTDIIIALKAMSLNTSCRLWTNSSGFICISY